MTPACCERRWSELRSRVKEERDEERERDDVGVAVDEAPSLRGEDNGVKEEDDGVEDIVGGWC